MDFNVLTAVPDDGTITVHLAGESRQAPVFTFPGTVMFMQHLRRENLRPHMMWFGPTDTPDDTPQPVSGAPYLNHMGDADVCGIGLAQAERFLRAQGEPVVFNHPSAVIRTRRDSLLRMIEDIPGVDAPKAVRFHAARRDDALDAIGAGELAWPVIVRTAGEHGGRNMIKLAGPDRADDLDVLPFDGRAYQAIEFRDVRGGDGTYRKWRLVFIGGDVFLRHVMMHEENWNLHTDERSTSRGLIEEEVGLMARFERETRPKIESALDEIARRVELDFFGVDCHIDGDGRMTVFEANPCMKVFECTHPEIGVWDDVIARSWQAMAALLRDSSRWRGAPRVA